MVGKSFTSSIYIAATPKQVWDAITTPEWTRRWYFDTAVESSWQVGEAVRYRREGATLFEGTVLDTRAPSLLVTTFAALFHPAARHDRPCRITWRITQIDEDVKLTVIYDDIDAGSATENLVKDGMVYPLTILKSILETGRRPPVANVVFDCADHGRLAQFWSQVTGFVVDGMGDDWAALHDPRGVGPRLLFYRVPESKTVKNRVHLDISVADRTAAEEQIQSLGGRRIEAVSGFGQSWTVMTDPEENEFCIA